MTTAAIPDDSKGVIVATVAVPAEVPANAIIDPDDSSPIRDPAGSWITEA